MVAVRAIELGENLLPDHPDGHGEQALVTLPKDVTSDETAFRLWESSLSEETFQKLMTLSDFAKHTTIEGIVRTNGFANAGD